MYEDLLATALTAAEAGAAVLRRSFRDESLAVERKGENDFVTAADRESERAIVAEIRRRHPDHAILAEEGGGGDRRRGGDEIEWLVDPLDGTTNFLQGLPVFCVSVACRRGDRLLAGVVHEPLREDRFTALAGGGASWNGKPMRVSGRPGLAGAFLATGYPFKAHAALDRLSGRLPRRLPARPGHPSLRRRGSRSRLHRRRGLRRLLRVPAVALGPRRRRPADRGGGRPGERSRRRGRLPRVRKRGGGRPRGPPRAAGHPRRPRRRGGGRTPRSPAATAAGARAEALR